jgi:hypothetical protein
MTSYNYSYNVLINRLEAFAAGHFLIKRFTHGQIDLADQLQDDQYPFMHVTPDTITPIQGGMQFGFMIMFADIPRDKEYKAEYQREVISDCVRLGQDLIAEVRNGLELFGFDVQLVNNPTFEPFIEEYKNTVTGVAFTIQLEVPWDWSACDIPAVWAVGGSSSGGSGTGYGLTLRTNGVDNAVQNILDLVEGTNVTITDNGDGSVTIDAAGGGGGGGEYVSTEWNANHTTAQGNPYQIGDRVWYSGSVYRCIANNDGINPSNPTYWTLQSVGYRLRQTPVDWNATSGDYQILNKPNIPDSLDDLLPGTTKGQLIQHDGTNWEVISGLAIDELLDVQITTPANGDALIYDSGTSKFENTPLAAVATSGDYNDLSNLPTIPTNLDDLADVNAPTPSNGQVLSYNSTTSDWEAVTPASGGSVTSVALTVPPAFSVTGSPITTAGTLAILGAGLATQYVRGDGQLANFPTTGGGGSSVSYYLNGSINQGTIGGSTYYQMSKTAILGAGTDFTRTNAAGNGLIAQFITDVNDPNVLLVPGGNFNLELYFSASSSGGTPSFYVELYKYDGSTFTLLATDVATPEGITQGTVIDTYFTALSVPATTMALTDRLALRVFVNTSGRTLVLHTENSHLCQVITTLSTGVNAINGLTAQVQNLATGTAGTDFGISSTGSTHTFNLPTASAANRGALSSADWSTFNGKQNSIGLTTVGTNLATLPNPSAVRYLRINADNQVSALTLAELKSDIGVGGYAVLTSDFVTSGTAYQNITGLSFAVSAGKTYKWRATIIIVATGTVNGMLSTNGPTGTTIYRFTIGTGGTTNTINNGSANNTGSAVSISTTQRIASADGIYIATANGTVSMSVIASVNALITIKAGSIVEFEEVA